MPVLQNKKKRFLCLLQRINNFKNGSYGKHLIQRIRDEAHRFAVEYHRKKGLKKMISSELDSVQGIGPKKRNH